MGERKGKTDQVGRGTITLESVGRANYKRCKMDVKSPYAFEARRVSTWYRCSYKKCWGLWLERRSYLRMSHGLLMRVRDSGATIQSRFCSSGLISLETMNAKPRRHCSHIHWHIDTVHFPFLQRDKRVQIRHLFPHRLLSLIFHPTFHTLPATSSIFSSAPPSFPHHSASRNRPARLLALSLTCSRTPCSHRHDPADLSSSSLTPFPSRPSLLVCDWWIPVYQPRGASYRSCWSCWGSCT